MGQRETTGHWSIDRKGNVVQTNSGGHVATFAAQVDAEAVVKLHNEAEIAPRVIEELRQQCQAQAEGWKEEARLRAEDARRHAAELEALTAPPKAKPSKVDEVIEKTETKKAGK